MSNLTSEATTVVRPVYLMMNTTRVTVPSDIPSPTAEPPSQTSLLVGVFFGGFFTGLITALIIFLCSRRYFLQRRSSALQEQRTSRSPDGALDRVTAASFISRRDVHFVRGCEGAERARKSYENVTASVDANCELYDSLQLPCAVYKANQTKNKPDDGQYEYADIRLKTPTQNEDGHPGRVEKPRNDKSDKPSTSTQVLSTPDYFVLEPENESQEAGVPAEYFVLEKQGALDSDETGGVHTYFTLEEECCHVDKNFQTFSDQSDLADSIIIQNELTEDNSSSGRKDHYLADSSATELNEACLERTFEETADFVKTQTGLNQDFASETEKIKGTVHLKDQPLQDVSEPPCPQTLEPTVSSSCPDIIESKPFVATEKTRRIKAKKAVKSPNPEEHIAQVSAERNCSNLPVDVIQPKSSAQEENSRQQTAKYHNVEEVNTPRSELGEVTRLPTYANMRRGENGFQSSERKARKRKPKNKNLYREPTYENYKR